MYLYQRISRDVPEMFTILSDMNEKVCLMQNWLGVLVLVFMSIDGSRCLQSVSTCLGSSNISRRMASQLKM